MLCTRLARRFLTCQSQVNRSYMYRDKSSYRDTRGNLGGNVSTKPLRRNQIRINAVIHVSKFVLVTHSDTFVYLPLVLYMIVFGWGDSGCKGY